MQYREGKQELLIFLLDLSLSMYSVQSGPDENSPTNKHVQVENCVKQLLEKISASNKNEHILVSMVAFASKAVTPKVFFTTEDGYYTAKEYVKDNKVSKFKKECELQRSSCIGINTSIIDAFQEAKTIIKTYCDDDDIAPEHKKGITIMLFTDGTDNCSDQMLIDLQSQIIEAKKMFTDSSTVNDKNDNFNICSIAIGKDADQQTLITIASPLSLKLQKHLDTLMKADKRVARILTVPDVCYLKINTENDNISESEISILRKLLLLVTETAV